MGAEMTSVGLHCRASIVSMLVLAVLGLAFAGPVRAQEATACSVPTGAGAVPRRIQASDSACVTKPDTPSMSNDGKLVAYVDHGQVKVRSVDGTETWLPEISVDENEKSPTWSRDDNALYFLSSSSDAATLWRVGRTGTRKAQQIAAINGGADEINLSPDQSRLLLTRHCSPKTAPDQATPRCPDPAAPTVITGIAYKKDYTGFSVGEGPDRIYAFNISTGLLSPITGDSQAGDATGQGTDSDPAWSPDGKQIAFIRDYPSKLEYANELWIAPSDLTGRGIATRLTYTPRDSQAERRSPRWSGDGKLIGYLRYDGRYGAYALPQLAVFSLSDRKETILTEKLDRAVTAFRFSPDGRFIYFTYANEGGWHLARVRLQDGAIESLVKGERFITAMEIGGDDHLALVMQEGNQTPKLYFYQPGRSPALLADPNADYVKGLIVASREKISVPLYGAGEFEAFVTKPIGYDPARKYPTLLYIHGGPVADYTYGFEFDSQYFAANGYLVIEPNPPGSRGRGQNDVLQIKGNWGCTNYPDILLAVDRAIDLGLADPQRLAVAGYSYGGYLTNCIVTRVPGKFRAAVSGAGHSFVAANYGSDVWLKWYRWELGPPWKRENRDAYNRLSPLNDAERVKTPTLFLSGDQDWNVPLLNSELFYEALREQGVDSRLVVYPGAGHVDGWDSVSTENYYSEMLNWLNKHMGER